ncbi:hypothetical protein [Parabacteroides sp. PF5-6]|uniref:hypothetical protein n=1 Tax=Parabacteroides sp. PF5-6 TaxID=1742403 RepID=UPI00240506BC|nr:hypothetical protein [Parabacteroides sp. PF5-6]MDF9829023.1 hypothetical protein [Parabacteroides sp. PF5-6]
MNKKELKQRTVAYFPSAAILTISALDGTGIDEWLKEATSNPDARNRPIGLRKWYKIFANSQKPAYLVRNFKKGWEG